MEKKPNSPLRPDPRIHEFCKECSTYLFRDWHSGNYDCRFADVCKKRKEHFKSQRTMKLFQFTDLDTGYKYWVAAETQDDAAAYFAQEMGADADNIREFADGYEVVEIPAAEWPGMPIHDMDDSDEIITDEGGNPIIFCTAAEVMATITEPTLIATNEID